MIVIYIIPLPPLSLFLFLSLLYVCLSLLLVSVPPGAVPVYGSYYGRTASTILVSDLYCTGNETDLLQCTMTRHSVLEGKGLLSTSLVAGVQCQKPITCIPPDPTQAFTCATGDVQLFSGMDTSDSEGVLNYCINGRWTPFCTLDRVTATVACSQLGYTDYSCKSLSLSFLVILFILYTISPISLFLMCTPTAAVLFSFFLSPSHLCMLFFFFFLPLFLSLSLPPPRGWYNN